MAHIIEGTWDEIKQYEAAFAGHRLRVIIDPVDEEEDLAAGMPPPPFAVTNLDDLTNMLLEATKRMDEGQGIEVNAEYWEQKAKIVADRLG